MIFLIITTALVLCNFLGISRIPNAASEFTMNLKVHRTFILAGVMILYIIAGCFMDMTSFMFLTMPIIFTSHDGAGL